MCIGILINLSGTDIFSLVYSHASPLNIAQKKIYVSTEVESARFIVHPFRLCLNYDCIPDFCQNKCGTALLCRVSYINVNLYTQLKFISVHQLSQLWHFIYSFGMKLLTNDVQRIKQFIIICCTIVLIERQSRTSGPNERLRAQFLEAKQKNVEVESTTSSHFDTNRLWNFKMRCFLFLSISYCIIAAHCWFFKVFVPSYYLFLQ